jgi:hypothetical protein
MTHKLKQDDPDIACAKTILDKGWRQGAIFDPHGIIIELQNWSQFFAMAVHANDWREVLLNLTSPHKNTRN